jgi:hypothetical protein
LKAIRTSIATRLAISKLVIFLVDVQMRDGHLAVITARQYKDSVRSAALHLIFLPESRFALLLSFIA